MVNVSATRSASGVGDLFDDRDWKGIMIVGGLAAVGFAVATSVGGMLLDTIGLRPSTERREALAVAVGSAVAMVLAVRFLGTNVGGALGVGALTAVGFSLLTAVFGRNQPSIFRGGTQATMQSARAGAPSLSQPLDRMDDVPDAVDDEGDGVRRIDRPRYRSPTSVAAGHYR